VKRTLLFLKSDHNIGDVRYSMKRQPEDLITWEDLEKMTPKVEVIEITEEKEAAPPPMPLDKTLFQPKKADRPKAQRF